MIAPRDSATGETRSPVWSPFSFAPSLKRRLFFVAALTAYVVGLAWTTAHHEFWRDELHAWLISRDSHSLPELIRNVGTQGHGLLWYLAIWPLAHSGFTPSSIQALNSTVAAATAALLLARFPFTPLIRVGAISGYYFLYEWGVIARDYSLGAFLLLLFAWFWRERSHRSVSWAFPLAIAAHTSVQALILVFATIPLVFFRLFEARRRADDVAGAKGSKWTLAVGLVFASALLATYLIRPPSDSRQASAWHLALDIQRASSSGEAIINGFLPLTPPVPRFWNKNLLIEKVPDVITRSGLRAFTILAVALILLVFTTMPLKDSPELLVTYLLGAFALFAFSYLKYTGFSRHHGFYFLWTLVIYWLAAQPRDESERSGESPKSSRSRLSSICLSLLLPWHVASTATAAVLDTYLPFSDAQEAAALIRRAPGSSEKRLTGFPSHRMSSLVALIPRHQMYYLDRDAPGSIETWNWPKPSRGPQSTLWALLRRKPGRSWVVAPKPLAWRDPTCDLMPYAALDTGSISNESFFIYVSNCS